MSELIAKAAAPLDLSQETLDRIAAFLKLRLQVQMREKGLKHEVVSLALQTIAARPLQAYRMANALQAKSDEPWFAELITAAVRVKNILSKAGKVSTEVDPSKFAADAEKALGEKLGELGVQAGAAISAYDWEKLASVLAELAPVIAKFFEDVLVMDKDEAVKNNRLALLARCQEFFMQVGDFSLLK